MEKIVLPVVFGRKSASKLLTYKTMSLTFCDDYLITRVNYTYECPVDDDDEKQGLEQRLINEKSVMRKQSITHVGIAYDNKCDVYYVAISGIGIESFLNMESAAKAEELLTKFTYWLFTDNKNSDDTTN